MAQKAKRFLQRKTHFGTRLEFTIFSPKDGGMTGSLVELGYVARNEEMYRITDKGLDWIEKKVKR